MVKLCRLKESVMVWRVEPEREVMPVTLLAIKLPWIFWIPSRAMLSVVPVAMAMLPVKVVQPERADASPAFWMVVVEALQEAALRGQWLFSLLFVSGGVISPAAPPKAARAGTRYLTADILTVK